MKYLIYLITIIVLVGLQLGLFGYISLLGVVPNLLLLFVVGSSLQREAEDSFFIALLSGLFLDFLNGLFVGSFSVTFLLLTLGLYVVIHRLVVFELSWKYLLAVVAGATLCTHLLVWAINNTAYNLNWSSVYVEAAVVRNKMPLELIYNLLLAYPLYALATVMKNYILSLQGKRHRII